MLKRWIVNFERLRIFFYYFTEEKFEIDLKLDFDKLLCVFLKYLSSLDKCFFFYLNFGFLYNEFQKLESSAECTCRGKLLFARRVLVRSCR